MNPRWLQLISRPNTFLARYAVAFFWAFLALALNAALFPMIERNLFFLSIAAIVVSSVMGGIGPGVFTSVLTTIGMNYFLTAGSMPGPSILTQENSLRLGAFVLTGLLVAWVGGRLRSALALAESAIRARDEFISIVSHELKNPLAALKLRTELETRQLALKQNDEPSTRSSQLAFLHSTAQILDRTHRLLDDMTDIARIANRQLNIVREDADLAIILQEVINHFLPEAAERRVPIQFCAKAHPKGHWDVMRIEQVASNLISNAIKYGGGTPIEVGVASAPPGSAVFYVRDHGKGLKPSDAKRLFERFERLGQHGEIKGLGMGLFITRKIVELHQGRVWVESTPGQGATFYVELPVAST